MAYILNLAGGSDVGGYENVGMNASDGKSRIAQSFSFSSPPTIDGAEVFLRSEGPGAGGDLLVQIETNAGPPNKPSDTLANASLVGTISSFSGTTYAWYSVSFSPITLLANTKYWLVTKLATEAGTAPIYRETITADAYSGGASAYFQGSAVWEDEVLSVDMSVRLSGYFAGGAALATEI